MASPFILYGKPLVQPGDELLPLQVVGTLPDYSVGNAFEGRLDILNAIGKSKVEIVESSLPPGAYAYVDQITQEVVLKWPSFSAEVPTGNSIPNGDFEAGDDGSWSGPGWSIKAGQGESGSYGAVYENHAGQSTLVGTPVPVEVNKSITMTCKFDQGASSGGNLAGQALLLWCDAGGNIKSYTAGNIINEGAGGTFQTCTVTGTAPATGTVRAGFSANRKRQNKVARVDGFTWTHKYELGTKIEVDYTATIKVTDSANRVAYWTGGLWFNSFWLSGAPYPVYETDHLATTPSFVEASTKLALLEYVHAAEDYLSVTPAFVSASTKSLTNSLSQEPESLVVTPVFVSASTRAVMLNYLAPAEDFLTTTPHFASAATKQVLLTNTIPPESMTMTPTFIGASTA